MWYNILSEKIEGMKLMSEYCKCGSIMIDGSCTRKNCSNKLVPVKPSRVKKTDVKSSVVKTPVIKTERKSTRVSRNSKCITYKLSDLPPKEE